MSLPDTESQTQTQTETRTHAHAHTQTHAGIRTHTHKHCWPRTHTHTNTHAATPRKLQKQNNYTFQLFLSTNDIFQDLSAKNSHQLPMLRNSKVGVPLARLVLELAVELSQPASPTRK